MGTNEATDEISEQLMKIQSNWILYIDVNDDILQQKVSQTFMYPTYLRSFMYIELCVLAGKLLNLFCRDLWSLLTVSNCPVRKVRLGSGH